MTKPKNVDVYIAGAPKDIQKRLKIIRTLVQECAPKAEEKISYGMPYYGYNGRLVYFAYFKKHIGIYIMPRFLEGFEKQIETYRSGRATLQILNDQKIPIGLLTKILKHAVSLTERQK